MLITDVMGKPSATEPWGWQFDGHHMIINYFVLGDQVVMTPFFAGSEPVIAAAGRFKGTSVLQQEQDQGLAFANTLDAAQRGKAVLSIEKTRNNNLTEAWKDNAVVSQAGIMAADLSDAQRKQLLGLIALFVGNMADGHARVRMSEVEKHIAQTSFAGWEDRTGGGSITGYRSVILIEFDHQTRTNRRTSRRTSARTASTSRRGANPTGTDYGRPARHSRSSHPRLLNATRADADFQFKFQMNLVFFHRISRFSPWCRAPVPTFAATNRNRRQRPLFPRAVAGESRRDPPTDREATLRAQEVHALYFFFLFCYFPPLPSALIDLFRLFFFRNLRTLPFSSTTLLSRFSTPP